MERNNLERISVLLCVLAVVAVGAITYLNVSNLLVIRNQWIAKTHEIDKIKNEVAEIDRLMNFYKKEKKEFQKYLFQEKDIPGFLDGLSGFAQSAGINIVDMKTTKFEEVKLPNDIREDQSVLARRKSDGTEPPYSAEEMGKILTLAAMPINIKINGPYQSIVNFYRHLENFKQLISIGNIEIAAISNSYPALQCDFTLKIYSLKTLEELKERRP